jgi:hypothetical protein
VGAKGQVLQTKALLILGRALLRQMPQKVAPGVRPFFRWPAAFSVAESIFLSGFAAVP